MYINTLYTQQKGLSLIEILLLQLLKQNKSEPQEKNLEENFTKEILDKFNSLQLIETVKKKKKTDSDWTTLRLSKKGSDLLEQCTTPKITAGDEQLLEYTITIYLSHEDKERKIGNKKKCLMYLSILRAHLSLSLHEAYWLIWLFLEEHVYTKVLELLFFNANKHRYGSFESHFEDSPIVQFLEANRGRIEQLWRQKIKDYESNNS